ncbi:CocE/NonD family hydrolase [Microbacterium sp. NPDC096154]|uniref:CocE/NonD family hydrolase n=1 Tax=Microbacterium sp. NPDC096154 TaxID=3155549 RepID=UPI0033257112
MPFEYRYRERRQDIVERGGPPHPRPRVERHGDVIAHYDIPVPTRDGKIMWTDVFLPASGERVPAIASWTPYGKANPAPIGKRFPRSGVRDDALSELVSFEAPDPAWWVPRGYAVVATDMPGMWHSTGPAHFMAPEEAWDYHDLIEWIGTQEWCTGKVGLSGVSYLTVSQWRVAELNPPHLAAINPWEGWTDTYREVYKHGGIPETSFVPVIYDRWGATAPGTLIEDLETEFAEHPFFDEYWESKAAQLEKVRVPAFVTASWTDHGLHTRGTLEGFRRIGSDQKWLFVHGRKKWQQYYAAENLAKQLAFFEKFLKGRGDTEVETWAPVTVEVRREHSDGVLREAAAWPLPDTAYTPLYLGHDGRLATDVVADAGAQTYEGLASGLAASTRAQWTHTFTEPTDLIGHATAELWVSAPEAADMDLFVGVFKKRADGSVVGFPYYALWDDGAAALGWLRVSHRELDAERSTDFLPVLKHERALPLEDGGPTKATVEILPQGTRFEAGESLVLVIQGVDLFRRNNWHLPQHTQHVNEGTQIVHFGGETPSRLVIPIVPR